MLGYKPIKKQMLTVSGEQRRDSSIYAYVSILPQTPSHPGCHLTLSRVHMVYSMSLLVIHFKYSNPLDHFLFPKSSTEQTRPLKLWKGGGKKSKE